jgi:hypothetical protein
MDQHLLQRLTYVNSLSRTERRAFFEAHMDADTCGLCDKPVADGAPVHSLTGVHWECHSATTNTEALERTTQSSEPPAPRETGYILARAAGGHLMHTVDLATKRALCGHRLANTAMRMRRRSRWVQYANMPIGHRRCPGCDAIAPLVQNGEGKLVLPSSSA